MAYDSADGYVVMYANWANIGGFPYSETTTWEFRQGHWSPHDLSPTPSSRASPAMTYDAADGYVLLFGGWSNNAVYNDTWEFSHGVWTQLHPTRAPAWRFEPGLTYDVPDKEVVLYGGSNTVTNNCACQASGLHDTWSFTHGQWKNITNYNASGGPPRGIWSALAYDSSDRYVVLLASNYCTFHCFGNVGGWSATWKFVRGNWTNISAKANSPSPRQEGVVVDDPAAGYVIEFGGLNPYGPLGDTWTFHGGKWSQLNQSSQNSSPVPEYLLSAAYDNSTGSVILHPGFGPGFLPTGTWSFSGGHWQELPVYTDGGPSPRYLYSMFSYVTLVMLPGQTYVPLAGVVLFGGRAASGAALNDTWWFDAGWWFNVTRSVGQSPAPRWGATIAQGPRGLILFGGTDGKHVFSDTWEFSINARSFPYGAWHLFGGLNASPSPRAGAALAYDQRAHDDLLFGGTNGTTYYNDTWVLTAQQGWTRQYPNVSPPARAYAILSYGGRTSYASAGLVTLFGGSGAKNTTLSDTWEYASGAWTSDNVHAASPLPVRGASVWTVPYFISGHPSIYYGSPAIVFGGWNGTALTDQTWRYVLDSWRQMPGIQHPSPRQFSQLATTEYSYPFPLLLFGGLGPSGPLGDTWLCYDV